MKTKNMGITIFIFTCIFRHKVLEYPTNYQQHSQITGLYFHSNLTKVHSIPLHLHHRFSEQTVKNLATMKRNLLFAILLLLLSGYHHLTIIITRSSPGIRNKHYKESSPDLLVGRNEESRTTNTSIRRWHIIRRGKYFF